MDIRPLDPLKDQAVVAEFFASAADYVELESGTPPNAKTIEEFFNERPPGIAAEATVHTGAFDGDDLVGILGMMFGYPNAEDAYIGLLLVSEQARGRGVGLTLLRHATDLARAGGATRQLVAVLEANPKGRAFWEREGFTREKTFPPSYDAHTRHRLTRVI